MLLMRKSAGACSLLVERISVKFLSKPVCRDLPVQQKLDQRFNNYELYELKRCPDCSKLRRLLHKEQVNIETKNAEKYECFRNEMLKGGGKVQFPCLKIRNKGKADKWIYGSNAIFNHIENELTAVS